MTPKQIERLKAKISGINGHLLLRSEFPDMKGFSPCNLKYMQAFAEAYPQFVQQPAAQIDKRIQQPVVSIGQQIVE